MNNFGVSLRVDSACSLRQQRVREETRQQCVAEVDIRWQESGCEIKTLFKSRSGLYLYWACLVFLFFFFVDVVDVFFFWTVWKNVGFGGRLQFHIAKNPNFTSVEFELWWCRVSQQLLRGKTFLCVRVVFARASVSHLVVTIYL